ncbi:gliding motility-associated C-terminal domain-containing protein [candidate division KSB1 bacterium]
MKKIVILSILVFGIIQNTSLFSQTKYIKPSNDSYKSYIMVPKAFSPNYDGINDFFKVTGKDISKFEIYIYNRQGQLVYKSEDINTVWDGKYNGCKAQGGIYVWVIEYEGYDQKMKAFKHTIKGNLTLLL